MKPEPCEDCPHSIFPDHGEKGCKKCKCQLRVVKMEKVEEDPDDDSPW